MKQAKRYVNHFIWNWIHPFSKCCILRR